MSDRGPILQFDATGRLGRPIRPRVIGGLVRLGILGPLSVTGPTKIEIPVPGRRQRVLLAALAVRANQVVSVEELADIVFDGEPPCGAVKTIQTSVIQLRQVLGPELAARLVTRPPGYIWCAQRDELDLLEFESLCCRGDAALRQHAWASAADQLTAALRLWRGTPLLDIPSTLLRTTETPRLDRLHVLAVAGRVDAYLNLGRHEQLVTELHALTGTHRFPDHSPRQSMLAHESEPPRQLPPDVSYFTGRTGEFRVLTELLPTRPQAGGGVPIAVVAGTGGIGKTALVLRWAHRNAHHFPDGQLYANLHGFGSDDTPISVASVLRGFLTALGVPVATLPVDVDAQVNLYRSRLAGKRVLVVLDNVRDAEQARKLLPGSAGCMAVVTSRSQLPGLVVINGAAPLSLEPLTHREARDLLIARIGTERVATDTAAADELIRLCGGQPLALHLIAGRAALCATQTLASMARELGAAGDARAVFAWSYSAMPARAARAFRLIGLHPGPDVSRAAFASMIGVESAGRMLADLTRSNLLTEHVPGRFTRHDLLRRYAVEQLDRHDAPDEQHAAVRRMLDHYLHTARAAHAMLFPDRPMPAVLAAAPGVVVPSFADRECARAWCVAEQTVLLGVVQHAATGGFAVHAWQLPLLLADVGLATGGLWADVQRAALVAAERVGDVEGQAHLNRLVAASMNRCGRHGAAAVHLMRSARLFDQLGDLARAGQVEHELARTRHEQGETAQALRHQCQAVRLARQAGDHVGEAAALVGLGEIHEVNGDVDAARDAWAQALTILESRRQPVGTGVSSEPPPTGPLSDMDE